MKSLPWIAGTLGTVAAVGLAAIALSIAISDDGGAGDMHDTMGRAPMAGMMSGMSGEMPMMGAGQMGAMMGGDLEAMQEHMAQHMASSDGMGPGDHQQHHLRAQ